MFGKNYVKMLGLVCLVGLFNYQLASANITNDVFETIITSYLPSVYVIGSVTETVDLTYGAGLKWGSLIGLGLEYREYRPELLFLNTKYKIDGSGAGAFLFLDLPKFYIFSIGAEAGGGGIWTNEDLPGLTFSETWVASGRITFNIHMTKYTSLALWGGMLRLGPLKIQDSASRLWRTETVDLYEGGVMLRLHLHQISKSVQQFLK
jgi:hypothetical protein